MGSLLITPPLSRASFSNYKNGTATTSGSFSPWPICHLDVKTIFTCFWCHATAAYRQPFCEFRYLFCGFPISSCANRAANENIIKVEVYLNCHYFRWKFGSKTGEQNSNARKWSPASLCQLTWRSSRQLKSSKTISQSKNVDYLFGCFWKYLYIYETECESEW